MRLQAARALALGQGPVVPAARAERLLSGAGSRLTLPARSGDW